MKNPPINIDDVTQLHQQGNLLEAKKGYLALLKINPKDAVALHMLGILLAEEGDLDEAERYLEEAIALNAENPAFYLHLANVLKLKGLFERAAQLLEQLLTIHPNYAAAWNNLGTIFFAQGKFKAAIESYQSAIDIQPGYVDAYYNLGLALIKANLDSEAMNAMKAVLEFSPDHAAGRFHYASLLMKSKKFALASEAFHLIEKVHPFHLETQINLATCCLQLGDLNEAKSHYLKALHMAPNDVQILFNLGVIAMQQNKLAEAIEFYKKVVELDENHFDGQNNLAISYLVQKNIPEALSYFKEALRIQPQNDAIRHTIHILTHEKGIADTPKDYIRALFDSYADHYDMHLLQALKYHVPALLYKMIQKTGIQQFNNVLDLGCGTGLCGEIMRPQAKQLTGVDLSKQMLAQAREKHLYDRLVEEDIIEFLTKNDETYDLIMAGDLLVYFGHIHSLFTLIAKALSAGGMAVFNAEISEQEDFQMTKSGRFAHAKRYLEALIAENHLEVIDYKTDTMRTEEGKPVIGHLYLVRK